MQKIATMGLLRQAKAPEARYAKRRLLISPPETLEVSRAKEFSRSEARKKTKNARPQKKNLYILEAVRNLFLGKCYGFRRSSPPDEKSRFEGICGSPGV
jgi:hypothetical protein